MDHALRFVIGGIVVSLFAILGDVLRPKSFAGLFGAAPSVALGTLGLAYARHGGSYVSIEGRSMILGSLALAIYSFTVCQLIVRAGWKVSLASCAALAVWLIVAIGAEQTLIG
ncbi:hypothetical protein M2427_003522 [Bradyrhizobium sp. BR13661]|nr:hypothetical protein [Bradyrhizobium sp. BR13661]